MRYFLSAFLALNVAVATISGFYLVSEDERPPIAWAQPFALESDRSVGAGYAAILWLIVATIALGQLRHQPEKRLLWWRAGWVSCAILAVGIASDELLAIRDRSLDGVAPWHWIVVLMPALGPLTVCASSALWTVARRSPVTRQLLVTSGFLATVVLVSDAVDTWFRDQVPWVRFAEEGSELMLSAILIVVLVSWRSTPRHVNTRPLVFASIMALACVVPLAAYWDTALGIEMGSTSPNGIRWTVRSR